MNRRTFLSRFGIGVSAALALASLPVQAIEGLTTEQAGRRLACEHLRKAYNAWAQGKPHGPSVMLVSQGLFDAFEGEITALQRFTSGTRPDDPAPLERHLLFKGASLYPSLPAERGWDVEIPS